MYTNLRPRHASSLVSVHQRADRQTNSPLLVALQCQHDNVTTVSSLKVITTTLTTLQCLSCCSINTVRLLSITQEKRSYSSEAVAELFVWSYLPCMHLPQRDKPKAKRYTRNSKIALGERTCRKNSSSSWKAQRLCVFAGAARWPMSAHFSTICMPLQLGKNATKLDWFDVVVIGLLYMA